MSPRVCLADSLYGGDHVPGQLHTAVSVVRPGDGQAGHAVVTIPQQLDTQATRVLGKTVKPAKQIIENLD